MGVRGQVGMLWSERVTLAGLGSSGLVDGLGFLICFLGCLYLYTLTGCLSRIFSIFLLLFARFF
jgi:hypothetical protein